MSELRRIYVIGAPGSGKSHLATRLSEALGIPWYDLDSDEFVSMSEEIREIKWDSIREQDKWICEAVYGGLCVSWANHADMVIVLSPPRLIRVWRVITRAVAKYRGVDFPGQPGRETWGTFKFRVGGTWRYQMDVLDGFAQKMRRLGISLVSAKSSCEAYRAIVSEEDGSAQAFKSPVQRQRGL